VLPSQLFVIKETYSKGKCTYLIDMYWGASKLLCCNIESAVVRESYLNVYALQSINSRY